MRLRTRLALAFLLLSVVPLAAITVYSYTSNTRAFRRAVEAESSAVAADLGKRMEMVAADVGDRVDRVSTFAQARDWNARDQAADDLFALVLGLFLIRMAFRLILARQARLEGEKKAGGPGDIPPATL